MSNTTFNSGPGDPSPIPATLPDLLDEYAAYARRVRDLAGETIKQQLAYGVLSEKTYLKVNLVS